jgi:hypothetical protein
MSSDWFSQISESLRLAEIEILIFVVTYNPRKDRILGRVVERSVSYKIQIK